VAALAFHADAHLLIFASVLSLVFFCNGSETATHHASHLYPCIRKGEQGSGLNADRVGGIRVFVVVWRGHRESPWSFGDFGS